MLSQLKEDLDSLKDSKRAKILSRFFKTGKGQYGEGDVFLGITVPESRKLAQKYKLSFSTNKLSFSTNKLSFSTNKDLSFGEISELLRSRVHEERLIALLILVHNFQIAQNTSEVGSDSSEVKRLIFDFYLKSTRYINNWDLVDLTADKIVGGYLTFRNKAILLKLARSINIWERRIAIIATFQFIKEKKDFEWTLKIAESLLSDKHDLIHKAVGWMLREVGKRDQHVEEEFLRKHYKQMPRTMLRYSIERFDAGKKKFYLEK